MSISRPSKSQGGILFNTLLSLEQCFLGSSAAGLSFTLPIFSRKIAPEHRQWCKNAPMSVLKAFQRESPLIGTDIGNSLELSMPNEQKAGRFRDSGNVASLSEVMKKMHSAPDETSRKKGLVGKRVSLAEISAKSYFQSTDKMYT